MQPIRNNLFIAFSCKKGGGEKEVNNTLPAEYLKYFQGQIWNIDGTIWPYYLGVPVCKIKITEFQFFNFYKQNGSKKKKKALQL